MSSSKHFPVWMQSGVRNSGRSRLLSQTWALRNVAAPHCSSSFWFNHDRCCSEGRGRNAITPVMRYDCGWLRRRQHRRSKMLLHIAYYYCWHERRRGSLQTRWRTSRCLLAGLCTSAFSSGSDALASSQVEPRLCLHDFVLLLWNLSLDVLCGKVLAVEVENTPTWFN